MQNGLWLSICQHFVKFDLFCEGALRKLGNRYCKDMPKGVFVEAQLKGFVNQFLGKRQRMQLWINESSPLPILTVMLHQSLGITSDNRPTNRDRLLRPSSRCQLRSQQLLPSSLPWVPSHLTSQGINSIDFFSILGLFFWYIFGHLFGPSFLAVNK